MPKRSSEREQFLADIITGAVEGGTGYWAQVSQYQWVSDGEVHVSVGKRTGDGAHAVLHPLNDHETAYEEEGRAIDIEAVARGLALITDARGEFKINPQLRATIVLADNDNDGGHIDADGADVIVQAALFGEIVYG